jgi:predicted nucleotidyltransferase component of viral defense system
MAFREIYRRQAALLIRALPVIAEETSFALKGGTAINLFIRDMPRLSVDIDLTYMPVAPRGESLAAIEAALKRIGADTIRRLGDTHVAEATQEGVVTKLNVWQGQVQIKIEVATNFRGCVYEPETRSVSEAVEAAFGFAEIPVLAFADLYAGKILAALDRQLPHDLFDVRSLLANEGIDDTLRRTFIVYLLGHQRPMPAVLAPTRKDISAEYASGFEGMTEEPVPLEKLLAAREELITDIVGKMPKDHRQFLVSFERGEPDWALLALPAAIELPAIKWRQQKLSKLTAKERNARIAWLEQVLGE